MPEPVIKQGSKRPKCFVKSSTAIVKQSIVVGASALSLSTGFLENAQAAACGDNPVTPIATSCDQGVVWSNTGGTLTNNGTISGAGRDFGGVGFTAGVGVTGNLTVLINNGTIVDHYVAVWTESGPIGTIINNGLIQALDNTRWAIAANVPIGTIVNSGTIYGSIASYNAGKLLIIGASPGSFGTLTGSAGNASIFASADDIEFAGGNILLDSNVTVSASNKILNSGATLNFIRNRGFTGKYIQTSGTLMFTALSPTAFPKLNISGSATLSGGNIVLVPVNGQTTGAYTVLTAAGGLTNSITATAAGYDVTTSVSGNDLIVTLAAVPSGGGDSGGGDSGGGTATPTTTWTIKGIAAGGRAVPIGAVLDALTNNSAFQTMLASLSALPVDSQNEALKQLSPAAPATQALASGASFALTTGAVAQRQMALLAGRPAGKAAGSSADGTGAWGQILGNHTSLDSSSTIGGFHANGGGIIFGADKHFGADVTGGAAVSWLHNDLTGEGGSTGTDVQLDSYQLAAYGLWRPDAGRVYVSGIASVGRNNYDQSRTVNFLSGAASASYRGWQGQFKVETGYDIPSNSGVTVTPLIGVEASRISNDGYSESGLGTADLTVNRQAFNNVQSELGVRFSSATDTKWGKLVGDWQTGWVHSFTNHAITTSAAMGGVNFTTSTDRLPKDGTHIVLNGTLQSSNNISYSIGYEGNLRSNSRSQTATVKMRYDF